jgi:DnaB-like helicase N terminal domain/AAA domain
LTWDLASEQIVLGSMMTAPAVIPAVLGTGLDPADFWRPAHDVICYAIIGQHGSGLPADPVAVAARLTRSGDISKVGGALYLHELIASVPVAVNAPYYARIIMDLAARRRIAAAAARIAQRAAETETDVAAVLQGAEQDLADAAGRWEPAGLDVMDIAAFVAADLPFGDPVIPGLLHQQERVVMVAGEGVGKSTCARQAAVMTACGRHVFTGAAIDPARTLIVDFENPSASAQRALGKLLREADAIPGWDPDRCHIWSRPGGIDLRNPSDARLLTTVIGKTSPQLICGGPLYKMSVDRGERAEQLYSSVTAFLDQVRERFGCALWLEAHAPLSQGGKRDMRPFGSGIWSRWPEFGLALTPSNDTADGPGALHVSSFRGHREDRVWPVKLRRSLPWPWTGIYPPGTFL